MAEIKDTNNTNDYYNNNLLIISNIKPGDKLYYYLDNFIIDRPNAIQSLSRWYYSESRISTIKHLDDFIVKLFNTIDTIYNVESNIKTTSYYSNLIISNNIVHDTTTIANLTTYINNMKLANDGLTKLMQTYKTDIVTVSALEIIIEKIFIRIKQMDQVLKKLK